jgi:histidyl-tRNA synthetase
MTKPSVPKGTRDFLPSQVLKRNHIFSTIRSVFETYGYLPIETPTMENLTTLTGKYGEEGDRLLFKVLNNGDFLEKVNPQWLEEKNSQKLIPEISKRGLRYDLTVPFARFVVMHQNEIHFPFKRYQIQQVWRADRPQKGRYQEFYQCDVDVVGSDALMYEAELVQIYHEVFRRLDLKVQIHINNRKILYGLAEVAGITDRFVDMTVAIDKLDKIGKEGVINEMQERNISAEQAEKVLHLLSIKDIKELGLHFKEGSEGKKGIEEVNKVFDYLNGSVDNVVFNLSLARGLNYYTGCIFEVSVDKGAHPDIVMGSIGGGGRYDNLTEVFGLKGVSGVGVSFGAERIYDVMEELNLFPESLEKNLNILLVALDEESHQLGFDIVSRLRKKGIACDIYPEPAKIKKQMTYANARQVPFVGIIGETERLEKNITLKNMISGEQTTVSIENLENHI